MFAQRMLARPLDAGVPATWVTANEAYGAYREAPIQVSVTDEVPSRSRRGPLRTSQILLPERHLVVATARAAATSMKRAVQHGIASVGYRDLRQSYRIRLPPNSLTIGKGVSPPR